MMATAAKILAGAIAALGAFGALWGALGWHLDPIHEQIRVLQAGQVEIVRELAVVHDDLRDVVGYLRGRGGLPQVFLMREESCSSTD